MQEQSSTGRSRHFVGPVILVVLLALGLMALLRLTGPSSSPTPEPQAEAEVAPWSRDILTADDLAAHKVEGGFAVLPAGGPAGEPTVEFADPVALKGQIEVDLSTVDLAGYDQLHFDVWMEHAPVDIHVTLRGYPDDLSGRRWYVSKRNRPLERWSDIRLDLNLDDDLSRAVFEEPARSLVLSVTRPESEGDEIPRVRIHNVRLVRNPILIRTDYRETRFSEDSGLRFTYPLHLTNTTGRSLPVKLDLLPETLERFKGTIHPSQHTLAPGESWSTTVTLAMDAGFRDLPTGYAERAQVRVTSPALPGFDAVPIRGYRPVYLFAVVPPHPSRRGFFFEQLKARAAKMTARQAAGHEDKLDWVIQTPPLHVRPAYGMTFRCPECKSLMDMDGLYVYFCYSRDISTRCPKHMERVKVDSDHRLFAAMVNYYHAKNASLARDMALAWLNTGDARFAEKAFEILLAYERMFRDLPMVAPASTGFHNRFQSATLHERHVLENFADAYLALRDGGFQRPQELQAVADGLLLETLYSVNLHHYGISASQVDMVTQSMKAAVITGRWPFFADAIAGDGGVERILERTFDADGVGKDGGDYARQATQQIVRLAGFLQDLGLTVNRDRIEQIKLNNAVVGYVPLPKDHRWETTVLPHTGFTILVNGEGPTWRRASINWGSNRERGAHDFLTTVLHDQDDEKLLLRTRRIAWGRSESFFSYHSVSQNIPVVDEGDLGRQRLRQEYLRSDPQAAGVIITDNPERPAYPDCRLTRTLVLSNGFLLVLDRVVSSAGRRQFDFPVYGLRRFKAMPEGMAAFDGVLGESRAYRLPVDLHTMPVEGPFAVDWADGSRGLRMHMLGQDYRAFAGVSLTGWRAEQRDVLMLRRQGESATIALLYESTAGDHPKVASFKSVAVRDADGNALSDDRALGYDVSMTDGRTLRILVSMDGGAYRAGACAADAQTRIAIHETAP